VNAFISSNILLHVFCRNITTELEDAISDCDAHKETGAVVSKKEITLEVVMEELTTLKHLVLKLTKKQETHDKVIILWCAFFILLGLFFPSGALV